MHSRIFEISSQPIEAESRLTEYAVPEWFCGSIADYVDTVREEEREDDMNWLAGRFGGNCERVGDKLEFKEMTQEDYFRFDYIKFQESLTVLQACDLESFSGKRYLPSLYEAMYQVKSAYEDRFGFYVYDRDCEELMTLDNWVRNMNVSVPSYIGGIVDYHF